MVRNIVFLLISKIKKVVHTYRVNMYNLREGIQIQKKAFLDKSINISNIRGGTVEIDSYTEVLFGVCLMAYGGKIKIGKYCSINPYTIIYGHGQGVTIGDNVLIAGHCMIIPANHEFKNKNIPINQQGMKSKGIIIENNVWIGAGCVILDGVHIGQGSVIAAGSIVNKSVDCFSMYGGVPARLIKRI
ncbi:acyltransferase [Spirosoma sp. 48-14]|uniref:acyltransferase n=1 Tax=Spirosoma sp. 48-14 TaxID=1895854 RepID=UPI000AE675D8|nr:acyltransferase [Spirosoma sp. 48-14]